MRQIVLDTETTGLSPEQDHRIIEIGCIELLNRKFTGNRYHCYLNPQRPIDEEAVAVHGLTTHFLSDKPLFAEIAQEFIDFISGAELIIHNAPFDVAFINHELRLTRKKWKTLTDYCRVTDSLVLAKQLHIGQRNNLDALCKRYSVDNAHREFHGALLDSHLLAQVYLAMTGGQGSLFDETQMIDEAQMQSNKIIVNVAKRNLPVLKANENEMKEHDDYLQKILKKGKCVWLETA